MKLTRKLLTVWMVLAAIVGADPQSVMIACYGRS
jgi:hypothetical protein